MAANDTISDMLTRIRNANLARHQTVDIPSTKMTRSIAQVLKEEGFIADFAETAGEGNWRKLSITLKYQGKGRQPSTAYRVCFWMAAALEPRRNFSLIFPL